VSPLGRARVVPAASRAPDTSPPPLLAPAHHRRVAAEELRARGAAAEILAQARAEAARLLEAATAEATDLARSAATEARQAGEARLAAGFVALRAEDERRAERDLDRAVALAVVLAERLLGAALAADPGVIAGLARQALAEARGARRAVIDASPLDADALQRHLVTLGLEPGAVEVRADHTLDRGSLRISTNLGTLDAQLRPQLDRLARALRDTLQPA